MDLDKTYILHVGDEGKQVVDQYGMGIVLNVVDAEIYHLFGFRAVRAGRCGFVNDEWRYSIRLIANDLTQEQIDILEAFMNGVNNTVIGLYPPRLIDPPVTFVKIASANLEIRVIEEDLVGRGLGREVNIINGDTYEYWASAVFSQGKKNQLKNMWANRLIDSETSKPL